MPEHNTAIGAQIHQPFHYEQDTDPAEEVPNPVLPGQWWADTSTGAIKHRNDEDIWVAIGIEISIINALVAGLQDQIAVLQSQVQVRRIFVSATDPALDQNIIGGQTIWGDISTGDIKLRAEDNSAWIIFATATLPTPATDLLLTEDDQELLFDIIGLTENDKLSALEAVTAVQSTDLFALVQTVDALGRKVTLADLLSDVILAFSDVTTNDVSTTKHGFCPKLPDDPDLYLCGDGTWAAFPS